MICITRKFSIPRGEAKIINTRQYKGYIKDNFIIDLSEIFHTDFDHQSDDVNEMYTHWKNKFLFVADMHAPPITRRVHSEYTPWLTDDIIKKIRNRDYLKKRAVKTGSLCMHQAYKRARNEVTKCIKHSKAKHFLHCFETTAKNPQEMWKTINKLVNKKSKTTVISEIKTDNRSITDSKEMTNVFNDYFCNIGSDLAENLEQTPVVPSAYIHPSETEFKLNPITEIEVYKYLSNVKPTKSTGYDQIPPKLIKDAAGTINRSLTVIFNKSIISGIFPDDLKIAVLSPIFKGGDRSSCGNYRPISVLSVIAKILEKIVFNQLCNYLDDNKIITNQQSGFRKKHSTETSLLAATDRWYCNMDNSLLNGVFFWI